MNPNITLALQLLVSWLLHAKNLSAVLSQAQSEGRDLTDAELQGFVTADDDAKKRLDATIASLSDTPLVATPQPEPAVEPTVPAVDQPTPTV
jgi:hypothetical protein